MEKSAKISSCGKYRFNLSRIWNPGLKAVTFVMLNPSTADADLDDPTVRRCIGLAKSWGYGAIHVVNLFAYRSTDPANLKDLDEWERIGARNPHHVADFCYKSEIVVLGWGDSIGKFKIKIPEDIVKVLPAHKIHHLGLTRKGRPKHPLFVEKDIKPIKYFN